MRKVENARLRFFAVEEEKKLTRIITKRFPQHTDSFRIALHTGMRRGKQFTIEWRQVDFALNMIHLDKTKNGSDRHIPINSTALPAFKLLKVIAPKANPVVFLTSREKKIKSARTWFKDVVEESKLEGVVWYTTRQTFHFTPSDGWRRSPHRDGTRGAQNL